MSKRDTEERKSVLLKYEEEEDQKTKINDSFISVTQDFTIPSIIREVSEIAYPSAIFFFAIVLQQTINLAFIGRKFEDKNLINAMGVCQLYMNCMFLYITMGLTTGMETLCSNAYGVKKYYLMGIYIHRIRIMSYMFAIVLAVFHFIFSIRILSLFQLEPEVLAFAEQYIYYLILYNLFDIQFSINFKFLGILHKNKVCLIIIFVTVCLHPLWCYILIVYYDFGIAGAGIAISFSQFLNMVASSVYIHFYNPLPESYFFLNKDCFIGLWKIFTFSLPAAFMFCSEAWCFEIQSIFALILGPIDYSVHVIISNVSLLIYTIDQGFGIATTITVGKYLTKVATRYTKKVSYVCIGYAFINVSVLCIIVLGVNKYILFLFTTDTEIIDVAFPVILLVALKNFFDILQTTIASVFRAFGKQKIASILAIFQFYMLQTILSYIFAFILDLRVFGLWLSLTTSYFLAIFIYLTVIYIHFDVEKIKMESLESLEFDNEVLHLSFVADETQIAENSNHK